MGVSHISVLGVFPLDRLRVAEFLGMNKSANEGLTKKRSLKEKKSDSKEKKKIYELAGSKCYEKKKRKKEKKRKD